MKYVLFAGDTMNVQQCGGKAFALAQLQEAQPPLPIPPWFVITPAALEDCFSAEQRATLEHSDDTAAVNAVLESIKPSAALTSQIQQALESLAGEEDFVAVRSSAVDEDGRQHSFAGQLDSFLFVKPNEVMDKVLKVWKSGYSERLLAYRQQAGSGRSLQAPAVLVQKMISADCAGVAFAVDPVSGNENVAVIGAVYGLGSALVSGDSDADTYHVDNNNHILRKDLAIKTSAHRQDTTEREGVSPQAIDEPLGKQAVLDDAQIIDVAGLVRATSGFFNYPQDIEWAMADGRLYLLQSRPITTMPPKTEGELNLWDNSNIAESYGGITTPLTFSFARRAYEEVYRQFCKILRVPAKTIDSHHTTFRRMLGLIRGRVYYNLLSWYRVLALLPGFTVNRQFMEQMMGVKEELPPEIINNINDAGWRDRIWDSVRLAVSVSSLVVNHITIKSTINGFYTRLNDALSLPNATLETLRADELTAYYHQLEQKLLTRWDAPLINDFLAMIFYGVLGKLCGKWCGDREGTLQNNLLCGGGGMVSAEPAKRVREMAQMAAGESTMVELLNDAQLPAILEAIARVPSLNQAYKDYLTKFGDRCLDELKLESETLHDDPLILLRSIGQLARRIQQGDVQNAAGVESELRQTAEARAAESLASHVIRRRLFLWVLNNARARVRDRENLRFERTRLFGRVRRIFVELGKRLTAAGCLQEPRDIFYLELNEVLGFVDATTTTTQLKPLVTLRKQQFQHYENLPAPADRFSTYGVVNIDNDFQAETTPQDIPTDTETLKGIGCCPGVVRGPVRVITDPRGAKLKPGEILVAERTDPGWIMLFPAAAGLLVERGSLLSHSAIVAREMGIPAVVSISGITQWLKSGDWVEFNGSTGVIRRITKNDAA